MIHLPDHIEVVQMSVNDLIPYELNNKDHGENVAEIVSSILKVGFRHPIEVDENNVILSGHGRLLAAQQLQMETVPVIVYTDMSEEMKVAYRLLANRVADLSRYNLENVQHELEKLQDDELTRLFDEFKLILNEDHYDQEGEDDAPIPQDNEPLVQEGDLFQLGDHYLLCGDATLESSYTTLLQGNTVDCLFTDPPYNVNYKGKGSKTSNGIKNDNMSASAFDQFLTDTFDQVIKHMQPQAGCYVFHSHTTQAQFEQALITSGFEIKKQLIRNKPSVNHIGGDYKQKHEPFFYCSIKDNQPSFYADCREITVIDLHGDMSDDEILKQIKHARDAESKGMTTIWSMKRHNVMDYEHPTQKPVGLVVVGLQNSSRTGEIILDPFGGSGTTLIASEKTGRSCHMMELDPKYIEVIIARYARYTNNTKPMKCLTRDISIEEIIENV